MIVEKELTKVFLDLSKIPDIYNYLYYMKNYEIRRYFDLLEGQTTLFKETPNETLKNFYCQHIWQGDITDLENLEIEIIMDNEINFDIYDKLLVLTTSMEYNRNTPGKNSYFLIQEKTSHKALGFIVFSSPTINMLPRNKLIPNIYQHIELINNHIINGRIIVPTQPFGYNALGGKMLALIMLSDEVREYLNEKLNMDILLYETTSLYGSIKQLCQYDGLEPYLKKSPVNTESQMLMYLPKQCNEYINSLTARHPEIKVHSDRNISSPKQRQFRKVVSFLVNNDYLPKNILNHLYVRTQKSFYYCPVYRNSIEYLSGNEEIIREERCNFNLEYIFNKWKEKAIKRANNLIEKNKFKTEVTCQSIRDL